MTYERSKKYDAVCVMHKGDIATVLQVGDTDIQVLTSTSAIGWADKFNFEVITS
jgi:hypothetical protein